MIDSILTVLSWFYGIGALLLIAVLAYERAKYFSFRRIREMGCRTALTVGIVAFIAWPTALALYISSESE